MPLTRRRILQIGGGLATLVVGGGAVGLAWLQRWGNPKTPLHYPFPDAPVAGGALLPTPSCADADATDAVIEGPFYSPNTPLRSRLREANTAGTPLIVEGRVMTPDCQPIAGAVVDLWCCDGKGIYDNTGFHLRGHQFTDTFGAFRFETVKPGDYVQMGMQRTPHLHVKVQGRDTPLLTTQLYFPGESLNAQDQLFVKSLVVALDDADDGTRRARFDFVLTRT